MKLREVRIKNFRSLVDISIPIDDLTVLIGENNSGKTSFLDTLNIVLGRSSNTRKSPFDEYDYHMATGSDTPKSSDGISIELWFREDKSDEWSDTLLQTLTNIIQTEPIEDLDSIGLRLTSKYNTSTKAFDTNWEFLNLEADPLLISSSTYERSLLLQYVHCFYLSALRDIKSYFSPRSIFWGQILRSLEIDDAQKLLIEKDLEEVNDKLLSADARLADVRKVLDRLQKTMGASSANTTAIRALPTQIWDLMSKSIITIKGRGGDVEFPLDRHGQGTQSMSVLSIFQAYNEIFLKPEFEDESEAIIAMEEPEAHLHPQVVRALASDVEDMVGQKIISSHSTYFIQEIPLKNIRMFSRRGVSSKVYYIQDSFEVSGIPDSTDLEAFCQKPTNKDRYSYNTNTKTLKISSKMEEKEYRELLPIIHGSDPAAISKLKELKQKSESYLSDSEVAKLEQFIKRIRGEILFARGWFLCEGQSEYTLIRYFASLLEKSFDHLGISVIDFQNNGSPGAFVGLASHFEIPWVFLCDGDDKGDEFLGEIEKKGIELSNIPDDWFKLPKDEDIELYLAKNGFLSEYIELLARQEIKVPLVYNEVEYCKQVTRAIKKRTGFGKVGYAMQLVDLLEQNGADKSRVPSDIANLIMELANKVSI